MPLQSVSGNQPHCAHSTLGEQSRQVHHVITLMSQPSITVRTTRRQPPSTDKNTTHEDCCTARVNCIASNAMPPTMPASTTKPTMCKYNQCQLDRLRLLDWNPTTNLNLPQMRAPRNRASEAATIFCRQAPHMQLSERVIARVADLEVDLIEPETSQRSVNFAAKWYLSDQHTRMSSMQMPSSRTQGQLQCKL